MCVSSLCPNSSSSLRGKVQTERGTVLVLVLLIVARVAGLPSISWVWRAQKPGVTVLRRGRFWRAPKKLPN